MVIICTKLSHPPIQPSHWLAWLIQDPVGILSDPPYKCLLTIPSHELQPNKSKLSHTKVIPLPETNLIEGDMSTVVLIHNQHHHFCKLNHCGSRSVNRGNSDQKLLQLTERNASVAICVHNSKYGSDSVFRWVWAQHCHPNEHFLEIKQSTVISIKSRK